MIEELIKDLSFTIGQEVYVIENGAVYNNLYRDDTSWMVRTKDWDKRKNNKYTIDEINIKLSKHGHSVEYKIDGSVYTQKDIFFELDDALMTCARRNNNHATK